MATKAVGKAATIKPSGTQAEVISLKGLLQVGGFMWRPEWIYWGEKGRGKKMKMPCYWAKKDGRGALSIAHKQDGVDDVSNVRCVYALLYENNVVYVVEGVLGERLKEHRSAPQKAGRWDRFSWVSPAELATDGKTLTELTLKTKLNVELTAKDLIETIELALLNLCLPPGNRQTPKDKERIKWLTQVAADGADLDMAENLKRMRVLLEGNTEQKKAKATSK